MKRYTVEVNAGYGTERYRVKAYSEEQALEKAMLVADCAEPHSCKIVSVE